MLGSGDLREILATPRESISLDFKERFEWADPRHKFELCRDIAGLANRSGGHLIAGVAEQPGGGFRLAGMATDDALPDPTDVNQVLRDRFDPAVSCEVAYVELDGVRYGVIEVPEFATYPHVCSREASVAGNTILRPGDVYVRTDALSTERARPADVRRIIEGSVAKTGAAIARLVSPATDRPTVLPEPTDEARPIFEQHPTRRALRLTPLVEVNPVRFSRLEDLIQASRVTSGGYAVVPRYIDAGVMDEAVVVREGDRLLIELERTLFGQTTMSVVEATRGLQVRIWESLWEDANPQIGRDKVNVTSLYAFAYAGLLFAWRFYSAAEVPRLRLDIGLTSPLGRTLAVDPGRFTGFFRAYRATSARDIWVRRDIATTSMGTQEQRAEQTRQLLSELLDYWGLHLADTAVDAQLVAARQNLDDTPDAA